MPRSIVSTESAPRAIGPYSQAVRAGDFVYLSGQIPLDPATGEMVGGDIEAQTRQVCKNLSAVLAAAGASWQQVVKTTIYLTDLADFAAVNGVYGAHCPSEPPARATVQVAALPRGARVEIDAVAYLGPLANPTDTMAKKTAAATSQFAPELLQASADTALDAVNRVGADEQADLVDAWIASGNVAAIARVAAEDDAPSPARKAARRGVNVLKARGVAVPEKNHVARPLVEKIEKTIEALFTPFETGGYSVITILARSHGHDNEFVDVFFNDALGVAKVGGGRLSTSRLAEWQAERRVDRGYDPVAVPVAWARWRLAQARARNAQTGLLLPLEFERYSWLLSPAPSEAPAHPATELGLDASPTAELRVAQSARLHNEPEFRTFIVPQQTYQETLQNLGNRLGALGRQPEETEINDLLRQEMRATTDRFFQEEVRRSVAAQMLDALLPLRQRLGDERALDVLATRQAVLSAGLITQPPSEIPFLLGCIEKVVYSEAARAGGQLRIPMPQPQAG